MKDDRFDGVFLRGVPASVFYPGRRRSRCKSFKPTHVTQRRIDAAQKRRNKKP